MTIFTAMGKRKTRGIGKAAGRAMNKFSNQGERLQRAWAKTLYKEQIRKIPELAIVSQRKDRAETLEIDVLGSNIVMNGHCQFAGV